MSTIPLNRGSDLTFQGTYRDNAGTALDLTGYSIAVYDPSPWASGMALEWVDASVGSFSGRLEWSESIPLGRRTSFRIRIAISGTDLSSPQIWVNVK